MKKLYISLMCLILSVPCHSQDLIIKHINIISMTSPKVMKKKSVLMKNGLIVKIVPFRKLKKISGVKIIDGKGKYLMPGLADMHVHLPEKEEVDQLLEMSLAAGITTLRVMNNSTYSQTDLLTDLANDEKRIVPNLHCSYLVKRDLKKASVPYFDSLINDMKSSGLEFIKLYSLANEEVYDELMTSAKKNNMIVCGHYPYYKKNEKWQSVGIEKVLQSGLRSIEHVGGYTAIRDEKKLQDAIRLTKKQGVYNCPTIDWAVMAFDIQYPEAVKNRLTYRTLPQKITSSWEQEYAIYIKKAGGEKKIIENRAKRLPTYEKKKKVLKLLYKNDCLLLVGSDGERAYQAPGFNLWEEMKNWSDLGIDNYTILKSATINAASFFKQADTWGTIEEGKQADLIILDKNPLVDIENISTIESTIAHGRLFDCRTILEKK